MGINSYLPTDDGARRAISYLLFALFVFVVAGIGWKLFGLTGMHYGAAIGALLTLLFEFGRRVVYELIVAAVFIAIFIGVAWGIYVFAAWAFTS